MPLTDVSARTRLSHARNALSDSSVVGSIHGANGRIDRVRASRRQERVPVPVVAKQFRKKHLFHGSSLTDAGSATARCRRAYTNEITKITMTSPIENIDGIFQ